MRLDLTPWSAALVVVGAVLILVGFGIASGASLGSIANPASGQSCGTACYVIPVLSISPVRVLSVGSQATMYVVAYVFPATNHLTNLQLDIVGQPVRSLLLPPTTTGLITINYTASFQAQGVYSVFAAGNSSYTTANGASARISQIGPLTSFSIVSGTGGTGGNSCSASGSCPYITPMFTYSASGTGNLSLTFNDTSAMHNATFVTQSWSFGDGSPVTSGFTVHHTYSHAGVYAVTLDEVATPTLPNGTSGSNVQDSTTVNITVGTSAAGTGGNGTTLAPPPPVQKSLNFGPVSVALIAAGAITVLMEFVPVVSGRWYVVLPIAGLAGLASAIFMAGV